jgi:hypothetical protein
MKNTKAADRYAQTTVHEFDCEGCRVTVRLDSAGKLVSIIGPGHWIGDTPGERMAKLAIAAVKGRFELAAKANSTATRTHNSNETRRDAAASHPSQKWLAAAYDSDPTLGRDALRTEAINRALVDAAKKRNKFDQDIDDRMRAHFAAVISEHRAREFLAKLRTK